MEEKRRQAAALQKGAQHAAPLQKIKRKHRSEDRPLRLESRDARREWRSKLRHYKEKELNRCPDQVGTSSERPLRMGTRDEEFQGAGDDFELDGKAGERLAVALVADRTFVQPLAKY